MRSVSYLQRFGEIELAVRRLGSGIPFIWGHSLMGSMRVEDVAALWDWREIEALAEVVRYDARGHGNSDGSYEPEDYRWPLLAEDMLAISRAVTSPGEWRRGILGGISMGAATALQAAVQSPDEVAGLVLALPPTAWDTRPRQAGIYRRLSWISGVLGAAPYRLLELLPLPASGDGRSRLALHTARGLAVANPLHVQAALRGAALSDMPDTGALAQLQVPTLVLAWEDDSAHPVATAERLAETMPDVYDMVVCDPWDHSAWQPAIEDFLQLVAASEMPRPRRRKAGTARRSA